MHSNVTYDFVYSLTVGKTSIKTRIIAINIYRKGVRRAADSLRSSAAPRRRQSGAHYVAGLRASARASDIRAVDNLLLGRLYGRGPLGASRFDSLRPAMGVVSRRIRPRGLAALGRSQCDALDHHRRPDERLAARHVDLLVGSRLYRLLCRR